MILNFKRLMKPLIIAGTGFLSLIFMFFPYVSPAFLEKYSAYRCMGLGSSSPAAMVKAFEFDAAGVMYIVAFMMIILFLASLVLLLSGIAMIVREMFGLNLIIKVNPRLVDRITQYSLLAHSAANILGTLMVAVFCIANAGGIASLFDSTLPGVSMFFLLLISVGASVSLFVLERKLFSKPYLLRKVHICTQCGAYYGAPFQCCSVCGGALALQQVTVPNDFTANPPEVKDFDYALIPLFFKNLWAKVLGFFEKKNISHKQVYIGCAALGGVLLVAIVLLCIFGGPSPKYIALDDSAYIPLGHNDGKIYFLTNGDIEIVDIEEDTFYSLQTSLDGTTVAWLTSNDTLYLYRKGELTEVAKDVESFLLSAEGAGIAYVDGDRDLRLYSVKKDSGEKISSDVLEESFCISPNGQSVAYVKETDDEYKMYVSVNGKEEEKIGNRLYPYAISDKGEFLYYLNLENEALYVMEDLEDSTKLTPDDSRYSLRLYLNADHTQLLFDMSSNIYVVDNGDEKIKITSNGMDQFGDFEIFGTVQDEKRSCVTWPVEELEEQYFLNDEGGLYYLDSSFEPHHVASSVSYFHTSEAGDVLYYVAGYSDTLYRGEGNGKKMEAKQIASGVYGFVITADGTHCYYENSSDQLMYVKKNGAPKKIADDIYNFVVSHDGYAFVVCDYSSSTGGTLYSSHNGSEKKRLSEGVDDEMLVTTGGTYYVKIDGDDGIIFGAPKKMKFSKLYVMEGH